MVREIRVYVEGGGDGRHTKTDFRHGFSEFLKEVVSKVRSKGIRWSIIVCGSRNHTYDDFLIALKTHSDSFNVLLVDSEGPVNNSPCYHLKKNDKWDFNRNQDENCHLMVQMMESWLIADVDALIRFYGQNFNASAIPNSTNIELIDKKELYSILEKATKRTYHKIQHAPKILALLNANKVRKVAPHCERFFTTLYNLMSS
jgi:hypothetical protein